MASADLRRGVPVCDPFVKGVRAASPVFPEEKEGIYGFPLGDSPVLPEAWSWAGSARNSVVKLICPPGSYPGKFLEAGDILLFFRPFPATQFEKVHRGITEPTLVLESNENECILFADPSGAKSGSLIQSSFHAIRLRRTDRERSDLIAHLVSVAKNSFQSGAIRPSSLRTLLRIAGILPTGVRKPIWTRAFHRGTECALFASELFQEVFDLRGKFCYAGTYVPERAGPLK